MNSDGTEFGKRIKREASRAKISLKELAATLNVDKGTMTNWLHGRTIPPITAVYQMAEILGVEPHWLWSGLPLPSSPQDDTIYSKEDTEAITHQGGDMNSILNDRINDMNKRLDLASVTLVQALVAENRKFIDQMGIQFTAEVARIEDAYAQRTAALVSTVLALAHGKKPSAALVANLENFRAKNNTG